jgi:PIN domain nuclease of toxin-antitoxin system
LRLLLDSNVLLWALSDRNRLTPRVRRLLEANEHELFVSRASVWELSIKVAKGKLEMPGSSIRSLLAELGKMGILILPIGDAHILRTETLPHHHGDPFDRMLVAQALEEDCTILSSDATLAAYDAKVIWR